MQQIETGYKPEFALGGLYAGMNAANAQSNNELELIRQFLANERAKQEIPLDMQQKSLQNQGMGFDMSGKQLGAMQAQAQMDPAMIQRFAQSKDAGSEQAIRKNRTEGLLQPFVEQQLPIEQQRKTRELQMQNELGQIDQLLGNGGYDQYGNQATPDQMKAWGGLRQQIVDRMGQTPELSGKTALEHIKGGYDLDRARISAQGGIDAANAAGQHGGKAAWAQALGPTIQLVRSLQQEIGDLVANPLNDKIAAILSTRGLKQGTPEYKQALESEKTKELSRLRANLEYQQQVLRSIQQASGFQGQPEQSQPPPGTAGNPIKLQ